MPTDGEGMYDRDTDGKLLMSNKREEEKARAEVARLGKKLGKRMRKVSKTREKLEALQSKVNGQVKQ